MRTKLALLVVLLMGAALLPSAAQARPVHYYVSLGDSLAVGFQPNAAGHGRTTRQGYADYLYRTERHRFRGLRLVHTHLRGEPLTQDDLTDLTLLRLDLVAAIGVDPGGRPGRVFVGHPLPDNPDGKLWLELEPRPAHRLDLDVAELMA